MEKATVRSNRAGIAKNVVLAGVLCSAIAAWSFTSVNAYAAGSSTASQSETEAPAPTVSGTDVVFSTDYPGVSVKPGDSTTFSLYLTNDGDKQDTVELSAADLPDGWTGSFKGSSSEVSMVHVAAAQTKEASPTLSYALSIPEDAKEGTYNLTLEAKGDSTDAKLPLTVKVDKNEKGVAAGEFTAEYPEQQGASSTNFSFSTTLKNNGSANATYALAADNVPDGWTVTFTPSGASAQSASVPVDAGSSSSILTTPSGNLSAKAYAGEGRKVTLEVQNTGNVALKNVQLTSQASTDWNVEFDNSTIDSIDPGASKEVTATITPAKDAVIGDYVTAITAKNDNASSEADLRVSVQNHTGWGVVAIVIIAALVVSLGAIIRKFGLRQQGGSQPSQSQH